MSLEWHFTDYPPTGLDDIPGIKCEYLWSDLVLIKCTNGDMYLAYYNETKDMWHSAEGGWIQCSDVACWASYGRVPETTKPMPRKGKV